MTRSNTVLVAVTWLLLSASTVAEPVAESLESKHGRPVMGNGSYVLSSDEERALWIKAKDGDNEASFRLALFYAMVKLDQPRAIECYRLGAERGHIKSYDNLGASLVATRDPGNFDEAERWLNLAKANGSFTADGWLRELAELRKHQ